MVTFKGVCSIKLMHIPFKSNGRSRPGSYSAGSRLGPAKWPASAKVADALMPKIIVGEFLMRGIRNIRCVGVAPGYTATPMLTGMNQESLKAILEDVHLGRLVAPEEIASMIGYCVENEALNATTIEITGGLCYPKGIAK